MCEYGKTHPVWVYIPSYLSHTGKARWDYKPIDYCIWKLVAALNHANITTVSSCCGHNKEPGRIDLLDGRTLIILE